MELILKHPSSFICAAAVHASQISDRTGGCGILNVFSASSNITSYPSSLSNGIQSIDFPTSFPLAFDFSSCENHYCRDLRWEVLGFNVGMMTFLMLVLDPEPIILFWTMVSVGEQGFNFLAQPVERMVLTLLLQRTGTSFSSRIHSRTLLSCRTASPASSPLSSFPSSSGEVGNSLSSGL